ncbi:DNA mismatch repair protein PMS2 [Cladobotryum mycophilum]|uniref:DNA mismatch repair protein PMS2 n=1 Tax=Cladobotryum mycophilum TaxID=491253 RepID=A0ABR0T146_9HYPO
MATIKQIDGRSIHQIQSGQVIVDLCSVVKELVENSIDAGASAIDVRFKNQGLDLIEVQDNGSGISPENYPSVALKHHTSKLSSYTDIASLHTFGFRGEALASLCALSILTVTTCLAEDVPKGSKLTFEPSGKLKDTNLIASPRGTTVSVEKLFHNLPVRRRELDRNIKREWQKVIALLNQYACIQTNLKFSVSQQPTKGKRILLFSTKGNPSTRENIINIFGAKTLTALVSLDLSMEIKPSAPKPGTQALADSSPGSKEVRIIGHVSRPVHGEGRQTPDRQMFFVNGRPCALPQFAKAFNEVYRSYNSSQSPFILADIRLDTDLYDVNVSPDKRSILLHDQNHLLDRLRTSLANLFDAHDYSVPVAHSLRITKQPSLENEEPRIVTTARVQSKPDSKNPVISESDPESDGDCPTRSPLKKNQAGTGVFASKTRLIVRDNQNLVKMWTKQQDGTASRPTSSSSTSSNDNAMTSPVPSEHKTTQITPNKARDDIGDSQTTSLVIKPNKSIPVRDFNRRLEGTTLAVSITKSNSPSPPTVSRSASSIKNSEIPIIRPPILDHFAPQNLNNVNRLHEKVPLEKPDISIGGESPDDSDDSVENPPKRIRLRSNSSETKGEIRESIGKQSVPHRAVKIAEHTSRVDTLSVGVTINTDKLPHRTQAVSPQSLNETPKESFGSQEESLFVEQVTDIDLPYIRPVADTMDEENLAEDINDNENKPSSTAESRMPTLQSSSRRKDATVHLIQQLPANEPHVRSLLQHSIHHVSMRSRKTSDVRQVEEIGATDAESKLPLIIAKSDFAEMRVAGQFNLGFIIAVRPAKKKDHGVKARHDELFIIDQHASDEKYNFERLQNTTIIQSQRLVHPKRLQLTALEEEIILENTSAIEANGFKVDIDTTGRWPVGSRCQLIALPLSRETTFGLEDLEELISLLGEKSSESSQIPRPSKVRKMLAMRACRSSVMIGKALTRSQMYGLVKHMGELDKPWNCPHGRPTMRHLTRLQSWDGTSWNGDVEDSTIAMWQEYVHDF